MKPGWLIVSRATAMTTGLPGCETAPRDGEVPVHDPHCSVRGVFSNHDRRLINDYCAPRYEKLPPGLAKKDKLPPGHAWRARFNQPIHDDARWGYLPDERDQRLTRLPPEHVRVVIGPDAAI